MFEIHVGAPGLLWQTGNSDGGQYVISFEDMFALDILFGGEEKLPERDSTLLSVFVYHVQGCLISEEWDRCG
jgi:hypothetical protein